MSSQHRALWAAHVAAVLFGLTGVLGALIQTSAQAITFGRAAFAVLATGLAALLLRQRLWAGFTRRSAAMLALSSGLLAIHWLTFFVAVKVGGVAVATLGFASFPAFIALVDALVFRERLGRLDWGMLALVSLGLGLVTPSFEWGNAGTTGLVWGLASGLAFGLLAVTNRRGTSSLSALQVAFGQNLIVVALVLPFVLPLPALQPMDWVYLAVLGVLCTGLSQYLFVRALADLNARTVGLIIALEPVYAIAAAWWLFADEPSARMLLGAALIVLATVLNALPRAPKPAQTPA